MPVTFYSHCSGGGEAATATIHPSATSIATCRSGSPQAVAARLQRRTARRAQSMGSSSPSLARRSAPRSVTDRIYTQIYQKLDSCVHVSIYVYVGVCVCVFYFCIYPFIYIYILYNCIRIPSNPEPGLERFLIKSICF